MGIGRIQRRVRLNPSIDFIPASRQAFCSDPMSISPDHFSIAGFAATLEAARALGAIGIEFGLGLPLEAIGAAFHFTFQL